jgi:hypothetical protein
MLLDREVALVAHGPRARDVSARPVYRVAMA